MAHYLSYHLTSLSYVNVPIALLSDFLPSAWDDASIFDNIINNNTFKYKPNNSQLKLYTYNNGWDDRDYIIFNTADPTTARNISPVFDDKIAKNTVRTSNTTGCIVPLFDATGSQVTDEFRNGFTIPRLQDQEVTWVHTGQTTRYNERVGTELHIHHPTQAVRTRHYLHTYTCTLLIYQIY